MERTGAWERISNKLKNVSALHERLKSGVDIAGHLIEERMVKRFEIGGPGWAPKKIVQEGHSEKPLVDTGALMQSISWNKTGDLSGLVGVMRQNDATGFNIALAHEMGTRKMPARPFVVPTAVECKGPVLEIFKKQIRDWLKE